MVAPINPIFTWQDGKLRSPQEVSREREIAEALMFAKPQATGPFGALGQIGSALSGSLIDSRADAYTEQGREAASNLFAGIGSGSSADAISAALLNPAAEWATPAQSGIAEALFNNEIRQSDPAYQLDLQYKQAQLDALQNPQPTSLDPTSGMQNYQFLIGQGVDPQQAQAMAFGGTAPVVNVNTGDNSGAFTKKADELAATRFDGIIAEGTAAQQMMGDVNTLAALGSQINTGKTAEVMNVLGPYAEAMGIPIEGLGEGQAYKAIVDRMAPAMRPAGSGSSSDTDVKMFLNSLPQLGNSPEGNQIITETLTALQQQKMRAAEIASEAMAGLKTWQQADAEMRALGNPYERFNEYRKRTGINVQNGQVIDAGNGITIRRLP